MARAARRHRLPSEAARRFEREVDPAVARAAADRAAWLLAHYGGATVSPGVADLVVVVVLAPVDGAEHQTVDAVRVPDRGSRATTRPS